MLHPGPKASTLMWVMVYKILILWKPSVSDMLFVLLLICLNLRNAIVLQIFVGPSSERVWKEWIYGNHPSVSIYSWVFLLPAWAPWTVVLLYVGKKGVNLRKSPVLMYLYYLAHVGISVSPCSNNQLFVPYEKNPFPSFFATGLLVPTKTNDKRNRSHPPFVTGALVWN